MQKDLRTLLDDNKTWLALMFVIVCGFFNYVYNYQNPAALFWDENYHVASAQKYLNGVYFMEPHPPLAKLFIALGEKLVHANTPQMDSMFIGTDYAQNPPAGFSFAGYRLFPVLFGWWTAPLLFIIFLLLTRRIVWSLLLSFPYLFDNALIVHQRSAMLESTMLFFSVLTILAFLLLLEWQKDKRRFLWASILFGFAFGCLMATKAFGLIFILLIPFALWRLWPSTKKIRTFLLAAGVTFAVFYCGIWQIHFALGGTINSSLPDNGYYQASADYKKILANHQNGSLLSFPVMLRDSLHFVTHYEAGVPRLNMCKTDENGSPWFYWPVGARSINYRWETPDGTAYRYLYLQVNPVVWFATFAATILSILLLVTWFFYPSAHKPKNAFLIITFSVLYISFMAAVSQITRVMYLYHYFLPLVFGFLLMALLFDEIGQLGRWQLTEKRKTGLLLLFAVLIFLGFQFYRGFAFYSPMTDKQVQLRSIVPEWDLHCVHCQLNDPLVVPGTNS